MKDFKKNSYIFKSISSIGSTEFDSFYPDSAWEMKTYDHYAYKYIVSEAPNRRLKIVNLQYLPDSVSLVAT